MTHDEQAVAFENFVDEQRKIMIKKGKDYSNEDCLSNFKVAAQICQCDPELVFMVMIAIKVIRMGNLTAKGLPPENESVRDTQIDLNNYNMLFEQYKQEKANEIRRQEIKSEADLFLEQLMEGKSTPVEVLGRMMPNVLR